jgi:uncharacterized protein (TIGR00730 family)
MWGGSNVGMMKIIADAAKGAHGKLIGDSEETFKQKARKNAHMMHFTKDLAERKAWMLREADAIVTLAGGIGTLDEAALALKRNIHHNKPFVFLNSDDFYADLKAQFNKMQQEGF